MERILRSIPIWNTPRKFFATLGSAKFFVIICLTITISVILNGKSRCFSVLAAELQNQTCHAISDTCGMATLNWIAFLSETIIVGGNPFITNMLIRVHSGVLGGKITFQFCMILCLGILLTGFVVDPESLFLTDTLIQGFSTSVILSLVTFKLAHAFPEENPHHRTALLFTETAPWFGVILCPLYGYLVSAYGWQSSYMLIAILLLIVCIFAGIVEPKPTFVRVSVDEDSDEEQSIDSQDAEYRNDRSISDYWEIEDGIDGDCQHPRLMQLLLNANISQIISRDIVVVWFVERAIAIVADYNLILNLVHYMMSILYETIYHASLVMITLGVGYIMGFVSVYSIGSKIKKALIHLYIGSAVLLVASFVVWQIYGSISTVSFTVTDTHFVVIVIGILSAISSAQSYYVAEEIIERPRIVSVSLTKVAQAVGLIFGPITSGMIIQISYFNSFFAVQAVLHFLRILLLAFILFRKYQQR